RRRRCRRRSRCRRPSSTAGRLRDRGREGTAMVEIYRRIEQHRPDLPAPVFTAGERAAWPFTLGGTVMNRSLGQAIHQDTDYVVASQVQAYLNAFLRADGWQWNPRQPDGSGGAVLDF